MKKRFGHLLPLSTEELNQLWDSATLTVDANVLLDLYRYHEETRTSLLGALEQFRGRLWISHQAAKEFFRHRMPVIATSTKDFDDADALLKQLTSTVEKLRSYRLVPRPLATELAANIRQHVEGARNSLKDARDSHPNFLDSDSVLDSVLSLFDGALGPEPTSAELDQMKVEAKRRQQQKIPPGYMDEAKDGEKAFGDYLLWAQVLAQMAKAHQPLILVTSERKEDWWEKHHGRRVPRRELLDDAAKVTDQRILIYETEHFLRVSEEKAGKKAEPRVFAEIRAVGLARLPSSGVISTPDDEVANALDSLAYDLLDSDDRITGLIAETNASGFSVDEIEVLEVGAFEFAEARLPFRASIKFTGEQDEDRMFSGDTILAEIRGFLSYNGSEWEIVDYEVSAEIEDWGEDEAHE